MAPKDICLQLLLPWQLTNTQLCTVHGNQRYLPSAAVVMATDRHTTVYSSWHPKISAFSCCCHGNRQTHNCVQFMATKDICLQLLLPWQLTDTQLCTVHGNQRSRSTMLHSGSYNTVFYCWRGVPGQYHKKRQQFLHGRQTHSAIECP